MFVSGNVGQGLGRAVRAAAADGDDAKVKHKCLNWVNCPSLASCLTWWCWVFVIDVEGGIDAASSYSRSLDIPFISIDLY